MYLIVNTHITQIHPKDIQINKHIIMFTHIHTHTHRHTHTHTHTHTPTHTHTDYLYSR